MAALLKCGVHFDEKRLTLIVERKLVRFRAPTSDVIRAPLPSPARLFKRESVVVVYVPMKSSNLTHIVSSRNPASKLCHCEAEFTSELKRISFTS